MTAPAVPAAIPPADGGIARTRGATALRWWQRLSHPQAGDPGTLAQLRRSRSPVEALRVREAHTLARAVGGARREAGDWRVHAAADLARVLAHVRAHEPRLHPMQAAGWKRFAGTRRESDAGADRPLLAEARFRRLLLTGGGEDKVDAFRRLVALLGGTVNVTALADDFLRWNDPARGDAVRERWAFLYYAAGDAAPPPPSADESPTPDEDDLA